LSVRATADWGKPVHFALSPTTPANVPGDEKDEMAATAAAEVTNCRRDISFFVAMTPPRVWIATPGIISPDTVIVY
jgi:hypothetical protein